MTPVVQTSNPQQQALQLVQQQQHSAAHLPQQAQHAPQQQSGAGSSKQTQTVLVENPSGIDESGNEVGGCEGGFDASQPAQYLALVAVLAAWVCNGQGRNRRANLLLAAPATCRR